MGRFRYAVVCGESPDFPAPNTHRKVPAEPQTELRHLSLGISVNQTPEWAGSVGGVNKRVSNCAVSHSTYVLYRVPTVK